MSAHKGEVDWRWVRAYSALDAYLKGGCNGAIPYKYYGEIFDLDEDEVQELFDDVAVRMGVKITVLPDPTYH